MERSASLVVDTGPLFAFVDRDDPAHEACLALLSSASGPLVVPTLVIAEVARFLETRLHIDDELRFLADLALANLAPEPVPAPLLGRSTKSCRLVRPPSLILTRRRPADRGLDPLSIDVEEHGRLEVSPRARCPLSTETRDPHGA